MTLLLSRFSSQMKDFKNESSSLQTQPIQNKGHTPYPILAIVGQKSGPSMSRVGVRKGGKFEVELDESET